jgi:hypothetical protein
MGKHRNIIPAVVIALAMAGVGQSDLIPVVYIETGVWGDSCPCGFTEPPTDPSFLFLPSAEELTAGTAHPESVTGQSPDMTEKRDCQVLSDRSDSFALCLYTLIGLGVFRSGHWARPSLGFVPEWYHNGGPYQIGHSYAIGLDAFCQPTICFVQADNVYADFAGQCGDQGNRFLRPRPQFVIGADTSRGPPAIT